jgi:hypothetical protein
LDNYNVVTWQLKPLLERIRLTETRAHGVFMLSDCNATELDRIGAPIKIRTDWLGHGYSEKRSGTLMRRAEITGE